MRTVSVAASLLLVLASSAFAECTTPLFINEFHYDNAGTDTGEFIEIAGPAGTDLTGWSIVLYNGSSTVLAPYNTIDLNGSIPDEIGGFGTVAVSLPSNGLQNGAPDGFALVDGANIPVQFLCYEGTFTAASGVAAGLTCTDVGVSESSGTAVGDALGLTGAGFCYDDFTWSGPLAQSPGLINAGQRFADANVSEPEAPAITAIHTIQGSGYQSPMAGEAVAIEGIVVGDFTQGGFKGFFVQEEDAEADDDLNTSEGIFVYCGSSCPDIAEGDLVRVEGNVYEYRSSGEYLTEITNAATTLLGSDQPLPAAVSLRLPAADTTAFERVEGMRVELNAGDRPLVVNETYELGRYGSFTVASERLVQFTQTHEANATGYEAHLDALALKSIVVDDGQSTQNPETVLYPSGGLSYENTLRSGYTIAAIPGVLDQRYGTYRLQPTAATDLVFNSDDNPRTDTVPPKGCARNALRVASFNVLNYFNTFEDCRGGVDGELLDCRGAESAEEFARQRVKIINAMSAIGADVFGLMEIENDGYGEESALADLVDGLNEKAGANVYAYVDVDGKLGTTNALGTDAIKVALIYNKKRVSAVGLPHAVILDEDDKNRPSLLQAFVKHGKGKKVVVSVNHLKSKGSACDDLTYDGVADTDRNDGAGNCNLTRTAAAEVLTDYIAHNKKLRKYGNVLLIGDFNAYAKETPILAIENAGYKNLAAGQYSYVYDGQTGTLDYALASRKLAKRVRAVYVWHINTDEPSVLDYSFDYKSDTQLETFFGEGVFRASDHDPVIVDLKL